MGRGRVLPRGARKKTRVSGAGGPLYEVVTVMSDERPVSLFWPPDGTVFAWGQPKSPTNDV